MEFSSHILKWYRNHKRDLPWRETKDPYKIWLSEIIMQQTRVNQGLPYYEKFVHNFPSVELLAKASEDKVLQLWQGLGYYSRGRNLHSSANYIVDNLRGVFPNSYLEIKKLKGVGEYTAAAIASFAYGEKVSVVDGNVIRVLTRYFGIEDDVSSGTSLTQIKKLANSLLPNRHHDDYNQGIMEFGALQCVPRSPVCKGCILVSSCESYKRGLVDKLPYKSRKTKVRNRYFNYLVIQNKNSIVLKKRTSDDIWQNLYDFPMIESNKLLNYNSKEIIEFVKLNGDGLESKSISVSEDYVHLLSHQKLHVRFFLIELNQEVKVSGDGYIRVLNSDLEGYGKPILIQKYLNKYIL